MAIAKLILNNTTQMDLTADTVTTSDHIMEGYVGHLRNGTSVTGTGKIAASDQAALDALVRYSNEVTGESDTTISEAVETLVDGYGQGGSSSSWTKVAETSYQVSTTSTSAATVATWATGHSELWTNSKWVYVRVRDTAGKRAGYFYGSDQFFVVPTDNAITSVGIAGRFTFKYTSSGIYGVTASSLATGYGVFADTLYPDGRIRIRNRYHSSNSLTIDGTYKVEVYLLDPAGGVPIFE